MSFFLSFLRGATGVSTLLAGRKTARETVDLIRKAKAALVGVAVMCGVFTVGFVIMSVYFLLRIWEMLR